MAKKFIDSGYRQAEIETAKEKALLLDRNEFLGTSRPIEDLSSQPDRRLTFVINRDDYMSKSIKKILDDNKYDIETLMGVQRVLLSQRGEIVTLHLCSLLNPPFQDVLCLLVLLRSVIKVMDVYVVI